MVLLVVKRQRLQRCVEFISTPHLLTNVAKMMSYMHMLVELLFTEEMLLAKFAEVMCWQGQHAIMATVTFCSGGACLGYSRCTAHLRKQDGPRDTSGKTAANAHTTSDSQ